MKLKKETINKYLEIGIEDIDSFLLSLVPLITHLVNINHGCAGQHPQVSRKYSTLSEKQLARVDNLVEKTVIGMSDLGDWDMGDHSTRNIKEVYTRLGGPQDLYSEYLERIKEWLEVERGHKNYTF